MPRLSASKALLLAALTSACAGCSILQPATSAVPVDAVAILKSIPRVHNRRSAPCEMQREVAIQNSAIEEGITGKPQKFEAPCDIEPAAKPDPKTS